jgi:preprotein translocase subunit SecE
MDEFVKVTFPGRRQVYVNRKPCGFTNDVIQVQTGTHTFDLGAPPNYRPSSQTVKVTGTLAPLPKIIEFQPLMDEFVKVTFPGRRQVYVNRKPCGFTNDVIQVQTGTNTFDLGAPPNYKPSSQTVEVTGTLAPLPKIIEFQPL